MQIIGKALGSWDCDHEFLQPFIQMHARSPGLILDNSWLHKWGIKIMQTQCTAIPSVHVSKEHWYHHWIILKQGENAALNSCIYGITEREQCINIVSGKTFLHMGLCIWSKEIKHISKGGALHLKDSMSFYQPHNIPSPR